MGPLVGQDLSSYYYPGLVDLVHLCVPGHPKADESFVEDRRFGSGNVQRLVLEQVVRHLGNNFCTTSFNQMILGQEPGRQLVFGLNV